VCVGLTGDLGSVGGTGGLGAPDRVAPMVWTGGAWSLMDMEGRDHFQWLCTALHGSAGLTTVMHRENTLQMT